jgi:DNA polymerase-1
VSVVKKCVLVDGSSYLFRAYHALPPLTNSKGHPTGAIYGVINMIRKLIENEKPDFVGIIFDAKGKTFRHEVYKEYKANRPPMPDELGCQIKPIHEIIKAMGFPLISIEGVEADDVIGTYAQQSLSENMQVLISTGDKDMAQLVTNGVTLINTMTGKVMDNEGVVDKFGVEPEQIIDYLALIGDTSDNVPGIPKVGPKTAAKWLAEYSSIESIKKNADKIKGKVGDNLRDNIEQLDLSRELVTIKLDCELPIHVTQLVPTDPNNAVLKDLFAEYELKTLLKEVSEELPKSSNEQLEYEYQTVLTEKELSAWIEKIKKAKKFVIDTETNSLNSLQAKIIGLSFSIDGIKAAYVPVAHDYVDCPAHLSKETVLTLMKPILENPSIGKVGQNTKYDRHVFFNEGITLKGVVGDTMLQSYVLNSTATRHDMDSLAKFYLQRETIHYEDVAGKGAKQIPFAEVTIETATEYAAEDAEITYNLHKVLSKKLEENKSLNKLYLDIELRLEEVICKIERNGVRIDCDKLIKQSAELEIKLKDLESEAFSIAGDEFNLGSPKQLQEILYNKLELPVLQKTPKGAPSTAEPVLQELAEQYELPKVILQYRSLSKLKSTYTDKLPLQVNESTNRVHTSYHQAVTATGRLSSSDPNLQNIPIRTEEGRRIRQAFIPDDGYTLVAADYSQIELRIMAHLANDPGLKKAFLASEDIHKFTASQLFHVDLGEVTSDQRRSAKAINFGLIYGMSAFGLAKQLDIPQKEARLYMEQYFHRYPAVRDYMDNIRELASKQGFVETILGRRLYLPEINSKNGMRRKAAERTAINAPMQGTAADIIKLAMLKVNDWLTTGKPDVKMIMQVHDELVFEVSNDYLQEAKIKIKECMESALELSVPLIVDVGVGSNWDEAH